MKNKVTVISNMYPTNAHKSFGIFVKNQVEELKANGLDVDVIAIDNPNKGKVNLLKKYGKWMLEFAFHLLINGRKTSVVHAHYVFPSGWLGKWYKKLFGAKFIVTAHGGDIDKMAGKSSRILTITKGILNEADHVIAVGQELYNTLLNDFHVPKEKLALINMGVNLEVFKAIDKTAARELCGISGQTIPLLFVGNIIEQKGLHELVEAFSKLKSSMSQIELYIIGSNKDETYSQKILREVESRGLVDSVHFLGTKNQNEVAAWMAAAEVFILPSHIEGFGLVALEAMACGTPVVGSNVGGLKFLLADDHGILVEPKNSPSLCRGIQIVLESKAKSEDLIRKGLERAKENDQKVMTQRVIELYQIRQRA